jgi:hypothetical protein
MSLQVQEIIKRFGLSIEDQELESFLVAHAFDTQLPLANLRKTGSHNIVDEARGVELMFCEREAFEREYGQPRSVGEGLLISVAAYPNGSKSFKPFAGSIGVKLDGLKDRQAIVKLLGAGTVQDEDEGVIYTESWNLEGVVLHADYSEQGQIKSLQFSLPLARR